MPPGALVLGVDQGPLFLFYLLRVVEPRERFIFLLQRAETVLEEESSQPVSHEFFFLFIPGLPKFLLNSQDDLVHVVFGVLRRPFNFSAVSKFGRLVVIWVSVLLVWYDEKVVILSMYGLIIALIKLIFVVIVVILLIVLSVRIESSLVLKVMGHYFHMVFERHFALVDVDQVIC